MSKNKSTSEIELLTPRRAPLPGAHGREAVALLAELLLDAAAKRRGLRSGGVIGSVSAGAFGSVTSQRERRREGREAA